MKLDGKTIGPFSAKKLKQMATSGEIDCDTDVGLTGDGPWYLASKIDGLFQDNKVDTISLNGDSIIPPKIFQQLNQSNATKQAAAAISDLRAINFRDEIVPIDKQVFEVLKKDFVFWASATLAVVPLVLGTLATVELQSTGFCVFFAAIWGLVFKRFIVNDSGNWLLLTMSFFVTGIIGIRALLFSYNFHPSWYLDLPSSSNIFVSWIGSIIHTGVNEELIKIIPVVAYIGWKRKNANPLTIVMVGIFSGLGFAAFENRSYQTRAVDVTLALTAEADIDGLILGVRLAMINALLRSISLVFAHAIWTGIFAYFLAMACATGKRFVALSIVGVLVAAIIHGSYNTAGVVQSTLPALIILGAFVLFYSYLTRLRLLIASQ